MGTIGYLDFRTRLDQHFELTQLISEIASVFFAIDGLLPSAWTRLTSPWI
jgi:hypothetical protein